MSQDIADLPPPLVPPEVDLRDFAFMPLDVRRLITSDTWIETADEPKIAHALICLWCEAWHQVPAASLPDNDKVLARLAMCDIATWQGIKSRVMRGWKKCSDGRFYHSVVAEKALDGWKRKQAQREQTKRATEERERRRRQRAQERDVERDVSRDVQRTVHQGTGTVDREIKNIRLVPSAPAGGKSSHQPPPTPLIKKTRSPRNEHPGFAAFWAAYPSRGEATNPRKPAAEKFSKLIMRGIDPKEIIAGAKGYAEHCRRSGKHGTEKVKQALTFLNQEVWIQYLSRVNGHGNGTDMTPPWKADPSTWNDTRNPPPWPEAPSGTRCGTWLKTSTGWQIER
jgi:uncharacterized protein DUF1376